MPHLILEGKTVRLALAAVVALAGAGCQIVGVVAEKVAGEPPVPAKYTFGPSTPLLILVENFRDPTMSASDAERVERMVGETLVNRKAALVISPEKLSLVRDARPEAFAKLTVIDIGKAVGAHQVLYIDLGGVAVGATQGSDVLKGVAHANVKVIDVSTGNVPFPQNLAEGYPIDFSSPMRRATGANTPETVRGEALIGVSSQIARLFYSYQASDLESIDTGL